LGTGGIIGGAFDGACTEEDIGGIDCDWSVFTNIFSGGMAIWLLSLAKWYHIGMRSLRLLLISIPVLAFSVYNLGFNSKIFPNIAVAGISVSGLSEEAATELLADKIKIPENIKIVNQNQVFNLNTGDLDISYDFTGSSQNAFKVVRSGNFINDMAGRFYLLIHPENLNLKVNYDNEKLSKFISVVAGQDSIEPIDPNIAILKGQIVVSRGTAGREVDQDLLKSRILSDLGLASANDISIPINLIDNTLSESDAELVKDRAKLLIGKSLQLKFEFNTFTLKDVDILKLLNPKGGFNEESTDKQIEIYASKVERDPQNPKFTFDNGRVSEFKPALDGIKMDKEEMKTQLISKLSLLQETTDKTVSLEIPVIKSTPEISTGEVNNLGIRELIGRGTSTYFHSIPSRVHNVALATSKINGTLVKPGETFSFNNSLGDVSAFTGYQQAYIISNGKTILGDGGGVCQVSTTLFRAILNGGLPVIERSPHAYRVGYYEQNSPPGIDATVYGPTPDLKFTNDTPGYILIVAVSDPKHYSLVFELYGTSDGRLATISKPVVSNIIPAPPTLYQDDPTLPAGTLKQTDFAAKGARVVFNYSVSRNGEQIYKKTFISNYRPWQAIYLRGTGVGI